MNVTQQIPWLAHENRLAELGAFFFKTPPPLAFACRLHRRRCLEVFYEANDTLELSSYKNVAAWRERAEARPATAKGLIINSGAQEGAFKEYHSD